MEEDKRGSKLVEVMGWKNCIMSFVIGTLTKFYVGDKLKENEMGRACGTCGRERERYMVLVGKPGGKGHLDTFASCLSQG
jgi:hypothetical protein